MEKEGLFTTVVGSLPLENSEENMIKGFEDIINVGIDYPCYPQLESMISSFLNPLSELIDPLEKEGNHYHLSDDFKVPSKLFALEYGEFITDFFKERPHLKEKIKGTKACLTGPFTLASEIILRGEIAKGIKPIFFNEPRAILVESIVDKLADIMKHLGKAYNDMGINIISMDEPMLSLIVGRKPLLFNEDFFVKTLNKSLSGIEDLSSIHVCGRISPALRDILLKTDVKILDHEFRTNEANFETFKKEHFENTEKFLALGTVATKISPIENGKLNDYVEDLNSLKDYIQKGIKQYGRENLIIKPDCGFSPLKVFGEKFGYEIALSKLKNMISALKQIK